MGKKKISFIHSGFFFLKKVPKCVSFDNKKNHFRKKSHKYAQIYQVGVNCKHLST